MPPCKHAACAAEILFAIGRKGKPVAFDAVPFLEPDVRPLGWLLVDGLHGKKLATKTGVLEALKVYVAHYLTCPVDGGTGSAPTVILRRRAEYQRSPIHAP